jgi:hypothetical protein
MYSSTRNWMSCVRAAAGNSPSVGSCSCAVARSTDTAHLNSRAASLSRPPRASPTTRNPHAGGVNMRFPQPIRLPFQQQFSRANPRIHLAALVVLGDAHGVQLKTLPLLRVPGLDGTIELGEITNADGAPICTFI